MTCVPTFDPDTPDTCPIESPYTYIGGISTALVINRTTIAKNGKFCIMNTETNA